MFGIYYDGRRQRRSVEDINIRAVGKWKCGPSTENINVRNNNNIYVNLKIIHARLCFYGGEQLCQG